MERNSCSGFCFLASMAMGVLLLCPAHAANAAVWTVTSAAETPADPSQLTLRAAVSGAADGDTIVFSPGVTTVQLTSCLFLNKSLTISGPATIRQTGTNQRVLYITKPCTLNDLTITGGNIDESSSWCGAGLFNYAELTMNRCAVIGNTIGGGIYNVKSLTMLDCRIADNTAKYPRTGAGICNEAKSSSTPDLRMVNCVVEGNFMDNNVGGGVFNGETLYMSGCTVRNNESRPSSGGGVYTNIFATTRLVNACAVYDNKPGNMCGDYTADATCTIGSAPNRSATAFSGYSGDAEPEPRSIVGDDDVNDVSRDLADSGSAIAAAVTRALSSDLGRKPGGTDAALSGMTASLFYANTFENVAIESQDLVVEYTASWPENVRYYSLFSRADGSGYEIPERDVQFELKAGQSLPDGVTPPDFYVPGEGLMTWRNVVTDGGSYDLNPTAGVVTFRVCSVRAAEATGDKGSGGGCDAAAGTGFAPLALLLVAPLIAGKRMRVGGNRNG